MTQLARHLLPAAVVLLCAHSPAQAPQSASQNPNDNHPAISAGQIAGVHANNGGLLGVAQSYRVTFEERSVTFQPALGSEAPRAHTMTIKTEHIRRGNQFALQSSTEKPLRQHTRTAVTYSWPQVQEQFTTRTDGLKHSFVFAQRPDGEGDLIVQLAIDTTLHSDISGSHWFDRDEYGLTIGDVVGVDANGKRCAGSKRLHGNGLELRLPASFVDNAHYPLELDPLISTAVQGLAGYDIDFPDVAYDAASDSYCVVWTQFLGGGQTSTIGSVWLASPLSPGYAFAINQAGDEDSIRVTNIAGLAVYVLVWVNYEAAGNWISGMALEPVQGQASNIFAIDGPYDVYSPIVSGEATVLDDDCLVVWQDSSLGLLGTSVTLDAQLVETIAPLTSIASGDVSEPAISKQGGNIGTHLITWTYRPLGAPGWIRAQVVDHDMTLVGPAAWVQSTTQNAGFSAVDGDGFKFLVAWEEQEAGNPSTTDVFGKILTVGTGGITSIGGAIPLSTRPNMIDYAPDVALLGDKFGLTYMIADPAAIFDDDSYVRVLGPAGTAIGNELLLDVTPGINYPYEHAPRLISKRDGDPNGTSDEGLVVFADQNTSATFDSDVGLQVIEAMGNGGPIVDLGGGCGPGGLAVSTGPASLGNSFLPIELYGAQPLAVPFVLLGMPNQRITCGVCDFVDPLNAWFVPNTAGTAATVMPIPGDPILIGFAFDFQFLSFNVVYVGCPLLPGAATSNIVRMTIDY
jgi:hypothetical protein